MKRILIPLDFSNASLKAALYGCEIAFRLAGELELIHVIDQKSIIQTGLFLTEIEARMALRSEALARLSDLKQELQRDHPSVSISVNAIEGKINEVIPEIAAQNKFDLIVMGTNGASGLKQFLKGSLTSAVIMKSNVPVIAVPDSFQLVPPKHLLLTTIGFEENQLLLDPFVKLATLFKATVEVVVFLNKNSSDFSKNLEVGKGMNRYSSWLNKRYPDLKIKTETLEGADFENAISLYQERRDIDLIALIHYPRNGVVKGTRRSISKKIVQHSAIPVLVMPNIN